MKYGILFKSIKIARYPYAHQSHVYCGKPIEESNEFYVSELRTMLNTFAQNFHVIMIFEVEIFQWTGSTTVSLQQTGYFNMG